MSEAEESKGLTPQPGSALIVHKVDLCDSHFPPYSTFARVFNCVDFRHDSAIQASLIALAAPKVKNNENLEFHELLSSEE